jgi:hypothetical protein
MSTTPTIPTPENKPAVVPKQPIAFGDTGIELRSFEDAYRFATCIVASGWAPKGMEKPEAVLVALQHGAELGLPKMASLQNIAVINGRPGIYGDAALALVRGSGLLQNFKEEEVGTPGKDDFGVRVSGKRIDAEPASETFTIGDAKLAGLWGKQGPWSQYPKRMLKFRARGFFLRDNFGDVLKGLRTVEELRDIPPEPRNVTPGKSGLGQLLTESPVEKTQTVETATTEPAA